MSKNLRHGAKKLKKIWIVIGMLFAVAILFHKPLLLMGCKALLHQVVLGKEGRMVSYERIEWEKDAIAMTGLIFKDRSSELRIDRVELRFKGSVSGLCLAPDVTVIHPQIMVYSSHEQESHSFPFLYRTRWIQPRWTVRNGVLQLPLSSWFYFSMSSLETEESIDRIVFSYDPDTEISPMLIAYLSMRDKILNIGFRLDESDLSRLFPLTALIAPDMYRDWKEASGEVELEGMVAIDSSYQIRGVQLNGSGKNLAMTGSKMGMALQCEEAQLSLVCPISDEKGFFWDKVCASILLKEGSCAIQAPLFENVVGIKDLHGQLSFEPNSEPDLVLSGCLFQAQEEVAFHLFGKGGVQKDSTIWSELELHCTSPKGKKMQGIFSLCSQTSKELALHIKVENADFEHLEFFRSLLGVSGRCVDGMAAFSASLFNQDGQWKRVLVENCHLQKMRWYFPQQEMTVYSDEVILDCLFETSRDQKWLLQDLHVQMEGGEYADPKIFANPFSAMVAIEQGILQMSQCRGEWGKLFAEVTFLGPKGEHFADLKLGGDGKELLGLLSQDGQAIIESLPFHLQVVAKMEGDLLSLQGDGDIVGDPFIGFASFSTSLRTWSDWLDGYFPSIHLKEGKLVAQSLTEMSYGPFVPLFANGSVMSGMLQAGSTFFFIAYSSEFKWCKSASFPPAC